MLSRKLFFHVRLKMKSVLKFIKQPPRAVQAKTVVHKINNKIRRILEKETPTKEPISTKRADIEHATPPPPMHKHGNSQSKPNIE